MSGWLWQWGSGAAQQSVKSWNGEQNCLTVLFS
jgi:hypothetical protein